MLDDAEEIEKLSISRTTFDWGVGLPEGFDEGHVLVQCLSWRGDGVSRGAAVDARDSTPSPRRARPGRLRRDTERRSCTSGSTR